MKKLLFGLGLSLLFLISLNPLHAQECSGTVSNGQNLVTNGDFSTGYSGWSHDTRYRRYTPCGNCWSVPGDIFVGSNPSQFNNAFPNITDHHGSPTGQFLMVDGICELGVNVWSQDEILIEPNTNYYFSVWITSLYVSPNRGTLRFDINGQALPETITPTGVAGDWIRYTAVWNSGPNPPSYATISIQNTTTTGCNNGVDFAIDDISFSPGCEFGSPGPTPNLGDDFSICGQTLPITLNPDFNAPTQAATNINYKWYKDGVEVSSGFGPSFYSYNVNEPGVYSVCVDSAGSCPKTAIINITDNYSIDLGPDIMLCDPITATLDARFTSAGVTYQWSRNGNPISGASSRTYTANRPGTYSVVVNDPSCGVQSDEVTIGTQAAEPVNGTYCPESSGGTGTVELSVIGDGKYKWWSAPEGGTALATGPSYSPPLLDGPGPYTYYVEDTSTFAINVGPSSANQMTNPEVMGPSETNKTLLVFNAHKSFSLDSLTVYPYNWHCPTPATGNANTINFIVLDSEGNTVGTSNYTGPCTGQGQPAAPMRVPVGINITAGEGYQLRLHTGSTQIAIFLNGATGDFSYPRTYGEAVEIVANHPNYNVYNNPNAFPGYFNWKITHGINCERVPVIATRSCPLELPCPDAEIALPDGNTICEGDELRLNAVPGDAISYRWFRNDDEIIGATENHFMATEPGDYKVEITSPNDCVDESDPVTINMHPKPEDFVIADDGLVVCEGESVNLYVEPEVVGISYQWSRNDEPFGDPSPSIIAILSGEYSVRGTNTSTQCYTDADPVFVIVNPLPDEFEVNPGEEVVLCEDEDVTLSVNEPQAGVIYTWYLDPAPDALGGPSVEVSEAGTYRVVASWPAEDNNQCSRTAFVQVDVIEKPEDFSIVPQGPTEFCENDEVTLQIEDVQAGITYQWYLNNELHGDPATSIVATEGGDYMVIASTSGDHVCTLEVGPREVTVNDLPEDFEFTADGPTTFCEGGDVTLLVETELENITYEWSNEDGSITNSGPSLVVDASGEYSVRLISSAGCYSDSEVITIQVNDATVAFEIETTDDEFCAGENAVISVLDPQDGVMYNWTRNGDDFASNTIEITVTQSGLYTASGFINDLCPADAIDPIEINVKPGVTLEMSGPSSICADGSESYGMNPDYDYNWEFSASSDLITMQLPTQGHVRTISTSLDINQAEEFTIQATVTSTIECLASSGQVTRVVTVNPQPILERPAELFGDTLDRCRRAPFLLGANGTYGSGAPYHYSWGIHPDSTWGAFEGINDPSLQEPEVTLDAFRTIYIYLHDKIGSCMDYDSVKVRIWSTELATSDMHICIGSPRMALATLAGSGSGNYSFEWTSADGNSPASYIEDASDIHSFINPGSEGHFKYYIRAEDNVYSCVGMDSILVHATIPPSVELTSSSDTVCVNTPVQLLADATGYEELLYGWFKNDTLIFDQVTRENELTVNPNDPYTRYTVRVGDRYGCIVEDTTGIHTFSHQELVIPNLFTPNGDNLNDTYVIRDVHGLSIFEGARMDVYNRWGKLVYQTENYDNAWDGNNLSDGVYYYNLVPSCGDKSYKGWLQLMR